MPYPTLILQKMNIRYIIRHKRIQSWYMKEIQKECIRCEHSYPINHFEKKRHEKNIRNVCKACRTYNNAKTRSLKKKWLKIHKKPEVGHPCACCGNTKRRLVFDHCHETEQFRGWICNRCNTAIGQLGDNLKGVMNAVRYLNQLNVC